MQAGLQDLIAAMDEGHETSSPPEQARMTVAVTQAILLSAGPGQRPGPTRGTRPEPTTPAR